MNDSVRDKVLSGYLVMLWLLSACSGQSLFPVLVCCYHLIARYHSDTVSDLFAELKPTQAAEPQGFAYCRFVCTAIPKDLASRNSLFLHFINSNKVPFFLNTCKLSASDMEISARG